MAADRSLGLCRPRACGQIAQAMVRKPLNNQVQDQEEAFPLPRLEDAARGGHRPSEACDTRLPAADRAHSLLGAPRRAGLARGPTP